MKDLGIDPDDLLELARDMTTILTRFNGGVGIAAPQLGYKVRLAVLWHDNTLLNIPPDVMEQQGRVDIPPLAIADMEVVSLGNTPSPDHPDLPEPRPTNGVEGCLTVDAALRALPNYANNQYLLVGRVDAPLYVELRGVIIGGEQHGQSFRRVCANYLARQAWHEGHHLKGRLFTEAAMSVRNDKQYREGRDRGEPWGPLDDSDQTSIVTTLNTILLPSQMPRDLRPGLDLKQ